jgi:cupin 2 domain-containing protein
VLGLFGNLFEATPEGLRAERVAYLVDARHVRIERIVSMGQESPPGFWYDQPWAEWVVVLAGSAGLRFEGEAEVKVLSEGDYILIPAHSGARKTPRRMDQQGSCDNLARRSLFRNRIKQVRFGLK